jgi:hypothetical protein
MMTRSGRRVGNEGQSCLGGGGRAVIAALAKRLCRDHTIRPLGLDRGANSSAYQVGDARCQGAQQELA